MHPLCRFLITSTLVLGRWLGPDVQAQAPVNISQDLITHVDLPNALGQYGQSALFGRTVHGVLVGGFTFPARESPPEGSFLIVPPTTPGRTAHRPPLYRGA